jgi:hypothetical protein
VACRIPGPSLPRLLVHITSELVSTLRGEQGTTLFYLVSGELPCRFTRISHLGSIQFLDAATLARLEVRPKLLHKSVTVKDVVPESISQKHGFEISSQHIILVVLLVYLCRSSTVLTYFLIRNGNGHSTVARSYTTEMLQILFPQ